MPGCRQRLMDWINASLPKATSGGFQVSTKRKIDLMCPGMDGWEAEVAAAGSGSGGDRDNAVLRIGGPGTSGGEPPCSVPSMIPSHRH